MTVAGQDLLILDTNVLIHVIRNSTLGNRIQEEFDLRGRAERPLMSIVTVVKLSPLHKSLRGVHTTLSCARAPV